LANLVVELPLPTDAPDVTVLNKAIQDTVDELNAHVDEVETVQSTKVSLLMQLVKENSFFSSNPSALFTQLDSATTDSDKIVILKQIANEMALFNSANAKNILDQLNSLI